MHRSNLSDEFVSVYVYLLRHVELRPSIQYHVTLRQKELENRGKRFQIVERRIALMQGIGDSYSTTHTTKVKI